MTSKTLTGTYSAGYTISSTISDLSITSAGFIGGSGLVATARAAVVNAGAIEAGGAAPGMAGAGGIDLAAGGKLQNGGTVFGGLGGSGLRGSPTRDGGVGGVGGDGFVATGVAAVTNSAVIAGGAGGVGGLGSTRTRGGVGGTGGAGIDFLAKGGLGNYGTVTGGAGGQGGTDAERPGAGGAGGAGVSLAVAGRMVNNGAIDGGVGGQGGASSGYAQLRGGAGGVGVSALAGGFLINNGSIRGGASGLGGVAAGGAGVVMSGFGPLVSLDNNGTIVGGSGGFAVNSSAGVGGAGIILSGRLGLIYNSGDVQGGEGGYGGDAGRFGGYAPGGIGGVGVAITDNGFSNSGTITGGEGGLGGGPGANGGYGATGGAGGAAVRLTGFAELGSIGPIKGGSGGAGGSGPIRGGEGGAGGDGVDVGPRGTIYNLGAIAGGAGGEGGYDAYGHQGPTGAAGDGIRLFGGGYLGNGKYGMISGLVGIYAGGTGATTIINSGAISGTSNAVVLGSDADVLIARSGARFVGAVVGGGGTLNLTDLVGTITGLGGPAVATGSVAGTFGGFGSYIIGGRHWTALLDGTSSLADGQTLTDQSGLMVAGSLNEAAGATLVSTFGFIFKSATDTFAGAITGTGEVVFDGGSQSFDGTRFSAGRMVVNGASLTLENTISITGTLYVASPDITVGAASARLVGGGTLALSDLVTNRLTGASRYATLINIDDTISGAGMIGAGGGGLINYSGATIDGNGTRALIIDVGTRFIANAGLIEATGTGGVVIQSEVSGAGALVANGGTLTTNTAVTQTGTIVSGALIFNATFSGNVSFAGASGVLRLAHALAYGGTISGFSTGGGTSLDLMDVGFIGAGEATYSGTTSRGTLTVTDGTHTARIRLIGDYLSSHFVASSDGHNGTTVVAASGGASAPPHGFVAAIAGLGGSAGGASSAGRPSATRELLLAKPHW